MVDAFTDGESYEGISFTYIYQPPSRWTFEQPLLKKWVEDWCKGRVLNLFGGKIRLNVDEVSNDIDVKMNTTYHKEAYDFVTTWEGELFDTIVLDPPYNLRMAREKYEGRYIGKLTKLRDELPKVLSPGGRIISLGYDTVGMSKIRGFKKVAICVVCHSGGHNDTLGLVEEQDGSCRLLEKVRVDSLWDS